LYVKELTDLAEDEVDGQRRVERLRRRKNFFPYFQGPGFIVMIFKNEDPGANVMSIIILATKNKIVSQITTIKARK
jgi:hypothetical protein